MLAKMTTAVRKSTLSMNTFCGFIKLTESAVCVAVVFHRFSWFKIRWYMATWPILLPARCCFEPSHPSACRHLPTLISINNQSTLVHIFWNFNKKNTIRIIADLSYSIFASRSDEHCELRRIWIIYYKFVILKNINCSKIGSSVKNVI